MQKNKNATVVIKVNGETKEKLIEYYKDKRRNKEIPYVVFQAQDLDTVITLYESGKVMFQGPNADMDAGMWMEMAGVEQKKASMKAVDYSKYYYCSSVGSDEVGTGDYFGPIVVTSCFVPKEKVQWVESLGIKDSKKMTDDKILKIAPQLAKEIKYKSLILSNEEYNEKHSNNDYNINKIKAIMHNKVLWQMIQEEKPDYDYIIVDEFAKEERYYGYLAGNPQIQRDITFMTKAEDKNLAVASASVISRYIFLKEFGKMCDQYHLPFPKGAGPEVDKMGEAFVETYGEERLKEVAKLNFQNTKRILKTFLF